MLEFICALQSEHLTPEKLFHELEHNHLLLIGSDFSNWLARLFLRMAKRKRLSDPRDVGEVFADDHTMQDERLVAFLQQVSVRTRVYGGAEAFVAELHARWMQRQAAAARRGAPAAAPQRFLPPSREMPENAIFISYAREDLPAVQRLKAAMDAAGLTTWFDLDRLEGGDDYDRKIRANIARCSFFVPVISATTQRRHEAYFRREWSYAVDRSRNIAEGAVFILPVCIDDTPEADGAGAGQVQGAAHHAAARWRADARIPAPAAGSLQRAPRMSADAGRPRRVGHDRPGEPVARPVLVHRGNPRLFPRPRRGGRRARPPRAAQAAHGAVRPVGPRQDLAAARRPRAAAARRRLLPGVRARRLPPGFAAAVGADQAGDLPGHRRGRPLDAGPGTAIEGESLWEFLHHRGDLLRDADGRTLLPLLIFDQFEEIFTLAQADDAGRLRAQGIPRRTSRTWSRTARRRRSKRGSRRTRPPPRTSTSRAPTTGS